MVIFSIVVFAAVDYYSLSLCDVLANLFDLFHLHRLRHSSIRFCVSAVFTYYLFTFLENSSFELMFITC